jgi:hypothetical protein
MHETELWTREESAGGRLDFEPHRGQILLLFANISMVYGAVALCTFFPAVISLPLGLTVLVLAHRDDKRIYAGQMDPEGRDYLAMASIRAYYGIFLSVICWFPAAFVHFFLAVTGLLP